MFLIIAEIFRERLKTLYNLLMEYYVADNSEGYSDYIMTWKFIGSAIGSEKRLRDYK